MKCGGCQRETDKGKIIGWLTGTSSLLCLTCLAIWYDGEIDPAEIKRHSLHWPVDDVSAYRKSDYTEGNVWAHRMKFEEAERNCWGE